MRNKIAKQTILVWGQFWGKKTCDWITKPEKKQSYWKSAFFMNCFAMFQFLHINKICNLWKNVALVTTQIIPSNHKLTPYRCGCEFCTWMHTISVFYWLSSDYRYFVFTSIGQFWIVTCALIPNHFRCKNDSQTIVRHVSCDCVLKKSACFPTHIYTGDAREQTNENRRMPRQETPAPGEFREWTVHVWMQF